jgi:hypothetical protein
VEGFEGYEELDLREIAVLCSYGIVDSLIMVVFQPLKHFDIEWLSKMSGMRDKREWNDALLLIVFDKFVFKMAIISITE